MENDFTIHESYCTNSSLCMSAFGIGNLPHILYASDLSSISHPCTIFLGKCIVTVIMEDDHIPILTPLLKYMLPQQRLARSKWYLLFHKKKPRRNINIDCTSMVEMFRYLPPITLNDISGNIHDKLICIHHIPRIIFVLGDTCRYGM